MSISSKKQLFFVRPDNFHFKDDRQNIRVFYATSGQDLLNQVIDYYEIKEAGARVNVELWSHQIGMGRPRIRLDTMTELPSKYENAWIRLIPIHRQSNYSSDDSSNTSS